jgi:branched-chain amino acid transport system ATP-binding protein
VNSISLCVVAGRIATLVGSNGAGKTTIMKAILGLVRTSAGRILFGGTDITRMAVDDIVRRGISLVPEGRRLFPSMSVRENLEIGAYLRRDKSSIDCDFDKVMQYFPFLGECLDSKAMALSGGQQQMLAVGRALMSSPKLLLLDEPSAGLAPVMVETIANIVRTIAASGVDVLLVEQNAQMALNLSDDAFVLENGELVMRGFSRDLADNDFVRTAYLSM